MACMRRAHKNCKHPHCSASDNGHRSGYCPKHRRPEPQVDANRQAVDEELRNLGLIK